MKKSYVIYAVLGTLCLIGALLLFIFSFTDEFYLFRSLSISLSISIAILGVILFGFMSLIQQNNANAKKNDDIAEQLLWVNNKLTALIKQNSGSAENGKTKPSEPAE